jgi:hypothetical protein
MPLESTNTTCVCEPLVEETSGGDGNVEASARMACATPDPCTVCNSDGSVCAANTVYSMIVSGREIVRSFDVVQYISGRNETIDFNHDIHPHWCKFAINGIQCDRCDCHICNDGSPARLVDCSNVNGFGGAGAGTDVGNTEKGFYNGGLSPADHGGGEIYSSPRRNSSKAPPAQELLRSSDP